MIIPPWCTAPKRENLTVEVQQLVNRLVSGFHRKHGFRKLCC